MTGKDKLQIGMLCYPRLTQLDLTGPYEVLCRMPDTKVHIIWKDTKPVRTESGFRIVPHAQSSQLAEVRRGGRARRTWAAGFDG